MECLREERIGRSGAVESVTSGRFVLLLAQIGAGVLLLLALRRAWPADLRISPRAVRWIIIYAVGATVAIAASVQVLAGASWIVVVAALIGAGAIGVILRHGAGRSSTRAPGCRPGGRIRGAGHRRSSSTTLPSRAATRAVGTGHR